MESAALLEFLGHIKNLHILRIDNCRMEHFSYRDLVGLVRKDNEITDLIMPSDHDHISDEHITDGVRNEKCKVTQLKISHCKLTNETAKYLSDGLTSDNCKLTELNVTFNKITAEGAKYFSDALKSDIAGANELTDEGA